MTGKNWTDITAWMRERAFTDPQFRQSLLSNPKPAIESEMGLALPQELQIDVREETTELILLRLPWDVPAEESPSAEGQIAQRAATDPAFRRQLLAAPRAMLLAELGIALPKTVEVQVLEETADRRYLVLPALTSELCMPVELPDFALTSVVGGGRTYLPTLFVTSGGSGHDSAQSDCELQGGTWSSPLGTTDPANTGVCKLPKSRRGSRRAC